MFKRISNWYTNLISKHYLIAILIADIFIVPLVHLFYSGEFHGKEIFEYYKNGWHHVGAIIIFLALNYLHEYRDRKLKNEEQRTLKELKELYELPTPLGEYAKMLKRNAIREILISTNTLLNSGLTGQDLTQKIEIIQSLLKSAENKTINRFWATSFDLPSSLFEKFSSFFEVQEKYLKNTSDKRRVVVLSKSQLDEEISKNGAKLREFILWHKNNNFKLKFLLNYNGTFEKKTHTIIKTGIRNYDFLTDFAIIGNLWIYGESTISRGKSINAISVIRDLNLDDSTKDNVLNALQSQSAEDLDIRTLMLHSNRDYNSEIWAEYEELYNNLWTNWHQNQWPIMTADQALSEIERFENLTSSKAERVNYYITKFPTLQGKNGIAALESIRNDVLKTISQKNVFATDLTSLKSEAEYDKWMSATYQSWLEKNIEIVVKNNCALTRVYVLNKKILNKTKALEIYRYVFKPQIDASIEIKVIDFSTLINENINFHDFFMIEDELCTSTQWYEHFETEFYNIENNFDNIKHQKFYMDIFLSMSAKANTLNSWPEERIINYLSELNNYANE